MNTFGPTGRLATAGLACSLVTMLLSAPVHAACQPELIARLPITETAIGPVAEVRVSNTNLHLAVASGMTIGILSADAVARAGLKLGTQAPKDNIRDSNGSSINTVAVSDLTAGGEAFPPATFMVAPRLRGVDGLIGTEIVGLADIDYDIGNSTVRFFKATKCNSSEMFPQSLSSSIHFVDLVKDAPPYLFDVMIRINGIPTVARLSTTSPVTYVSKDFAKRSKIKMLEPRRSNPASPIINQVGKVDSWNMGDDVRSEVEVSVIDGTSDVAVLIGLDFFKSHRVYVSRASRKVFFSSNS